MTIIRFSLRIRFQDVADYITTEESFVALRGYFFRLKGVELRIGSKEVGRKSDYRIRVDGEFRSKTGVWSEDKAREFWKELNEFLSCKGARYENWVTVANAGEENNGKPD